MAKKNIQLNPGSQEAFVNSPHRYAAYIGGIGSGKTFAGIARGLKFTQQPQSTQTSQGPRGIIAAINYPVLQDVVLPQFLEMVEGTGLLKQFHKQEKRATMTNGAEILFRSMDKPDWIRGVEISWFFIDEGRHVTKETWDILTGRLRQRGYEHSGWVCSTPNGYDWMYNLFHQDSDIKLTDAMWYAAPTMENLHLPEEYVADLKNNYHGLWYDQEVLGKFVGIMSGAVFPHWDPKKHLREFDYDPMLPLYSFWDFGIGDLGVVLFAQIDFIEQPILYRGGSEFYAVLKFIDVLEGKDRSVSEWAREWNNWLDRNVNGRRPDLNIGDPAGRARSAVTGTSVIDALLAEGVPIVPAPKRPPDYSIRILDNMMAGDRVLARKASCSVLSRAFAGYHFKTDDAGNRTGTKPIHDWTSHYADAARYGAAQLLAHSPKRTDPPPPMKPGRGTLGWVLNRIDEVDLGDRLIGQEKPALTWM